MQTPNHSFFLSVVPPPSTPVLCDNKYEVQSGCGPQLLKMRATADRYLVALLQPFHSALAPLVSLIPHPLCRCHTNLSINHLVVTYEGGESGITGATGGKNPPWG